MISGLCHHVFPFLPGLSGRPALLAVGMLWLMDTLQLIGDFGFGF